MGQRDRGSEQRNSGAWIAPLTVAAGLLILWIGLRFPIHSTPEADSGLTSGVANSRAYNFNSISAMAAESDLVAEVTVEDVSPGNISSTEADYRLRVERVLANHSGDEIGQHISDHELGHPAARGVWIEDSVILHPGQRLFLFLKRHAPGKFTTIAGEQSAYVVHHDQVDSLSTFLVDHTPDFTGPMEVAAFEALIVDAAK